MKNYLLACAFLFFCHLLPAQNRQFSIGAYVSDYTKVEPIDPYVNISQYTSSPNLRINTSCYGLSAQWFPKWVNRAGAKNALFAEYLHVDHEYTDRGERSLPYHAPNGEQYFHNVVQHTYKNYGYTIGYKHFEPLGRVNLFFGAALIYFHYNATQYRNVSYMFNANKEYIGTDGYYAALPGAFARGVAFNTGFDFFITKTKNVSLGISATFSFLQAFVKGYSQSTYLKDWYDSYRWIRNESTVAGMVDTRHNCITPVVPAVHVKYNFNVKLPKWLKCKKGEIVN